MSTSEFAGPVLTGFLVSLAASIAIAATKRWHGRFSFDTHSGPQKIHDTPTPRIGGLALFAGLLAAAAAARPALRELLLAPVIGSAIAFAAGLAEDLTKRVSATVRLLATMLSGVVFCIVTGYAVTRLDFALDFALGDGLMAFPLVSIAFTVFVMAGLTNAFNIIDGFHGLAAGTSIIMLCALASLAFLSGDPGLAWAAMAAVAVLAGFLAVNFPFGYVFLGDGGAYVAGLLPGTFGIALAVRNPEVSVWAVAVVLAYPVLETVFSIARKTIRSGHSPGRPDEMHLHHLVYRRLARTTSGGPASERLANPTTSVVMWGGAATGLLFVLALPHTRGWALLVLAALAALYATLYRLLASPDGSRAPGSGGTRPPSRSRAGPEG